MTRLSDQRIYEELENLFPNAKCELNHNTAFQLAVAVILSAQATDVSVNKITPSLFEKYPDAFKMAQADIKDIEQEIKSIGLYHNKAKSILNLSKELSERFHGQIPDNMEELTSLSGIGRKSANVILSEWFHVPAIAVDTHVFRVSKRLGLAALDDDVFKVEKSLMERFEKEKWSHLHHLLIFFGRYQCKAAHPLCENCPFGEFCTK